MRACSLLRRVLATPPALLSGAILAGFVAGCNGGLATPNAVNRTVQPDIPRLQRPALVAVDLDRGALVYWPTKKGSSQKPIRFTKSLGLTQSYAIAANGNVLAIANYDPAEIVIYDVGRKTLSTLSDTYGAPLDVALDKDANVYAMNYGTVEVFKFGTYGGTYELSCPYVDRDVAVAVDSAGAVYVNGYGPGSFEGVIEYPPGSSGPERCIKLQLRPEEGRVGGVAIDPKNNDLIVVDNPGQCGGSKAGRMTIYPRPYRARRFRRVALDAQYCGGIFRLDKDSAHIYLFDAAGSSGSSLIDVRDYPSGSGAGDYGSGERDEIGGFITIPNRLPN